MAFTMDWYFFTLDLASCLKSMNTRCSLGGTVLMSLAHDLIAEAVDFHALV